MRMTASDHINQQAVASYVREAIWPGNKMIPKSWRKWRDDKRSLCQMILKKVTLSLGVDGKSYWEAMILGITNNKFCSLGANFKQELFEQFQGKFYSIKTLKWFSDVNEIMVYVFHINTINNENGYVPPSNSSGKIYVNARGWTSNPQDSKPTYDQAENFLRFLDKYVNHAVGNHYFLQWSKLNRSNTFLIK